LDRSARRGDINPELVFAIVLGGGSTFGQQAEDIYEDDMQNDVLSAQARLTELIRTNK
jgi:hypothetical protein